MRLRSFHGETMSEAMRQVREALGTQAVIVATRDDEQGGVRVTAAVDDSPNEPLLQPPKITKPEPPPKAAAAQTKSAPAPVKIDANDEDVVEIVAEQLLRHAVPSTLAEQVLGIVTHFADHDALIALGAAMDKLFKFAPLFDAVNPRPICLVGPPGAGKTLVVAKIAAQRVLNKKSIGVITTDLVRAGGVEQLAAYTRLLKLRLFEVEDLTGLKDAVESHKPGEFILIDNTGRNPFNKNDMAELKKMMAATDMEPVLVMPAGLDAFEACDMARSFMEIGVKKMILTKLDLARRLGSLMAVARESGLTLCEMSVSPKVTDPLQPLNAVTFARLLLPREIVARALKSAATA